MSSKVNATISLAARKKLLQMHHASGVGHIGGNLSSIDCLLVLFHEFMSDDDRLILSKGHSAGALYISLWSAGRLPEPELATFHRDNTLLPGHPPAQGNPDVLFATGSLGHGLSLAAGTAFSRMLRQRLYGEIAGHTYCVTSDGEWQEGSTWEALIFAQHQKISNLTILVDHNQLQGFGTTTDVASMSPLSRRLAGFDLNIQEIDGHDIEQIREACATRGDRTNVVIMNTVKGKGVSFMENRMEWHYLPLDTEMLKMALAELDQ